MKTKLILIEILMAVFLSSCYAPKYLPNSDEIDVNQFGSYIELNLKAGDDVYGELLEVDSNKLVVLSESDSNEINKPLIVNRNEVKNFSLRYAQPKHYGWTIPVGILLPLIPFPDPDGGGLMPFHGFFLTMSVPVNLIVTLSVTSNGEKMFKYTDKKITYNELKMFARFPQGIPKNIILDNIR